MILYYNSAYEHPFLLSYVINVFSVHLFLADIHMHTLPSMYEHHQILFESTLPPVSIYLLSEHVESLII